MSDDVAKTICMIAGAKYYKVEQSTGGKKIYVKVTAVNAYSKESAASAVKNVTVKK